MKTINQTILCIYSVTATLFLLSTFVSFKKHHSVDIFDEIQVQKIRIVEPDGTLRMILSNSKKMPGVIVQGKEVEQVDRPQAGMLFYNDEGSENGGLIFGGSKNAKGEVINSGGSLSFDKYGAKQEVNLIGVNDKDNKFAGLTISDSKAGEKALPTRLWAGRNDDGSSELALMDAAGKKRLVLKVKENGESTMTFLDQNGKALNTIAPVSNQ